MRILFGIMIALFSLTACTAPVPQANPEMAWIDLYKRPSHTLSAQRLDGKRVNDGRYFEVAPGKHELQMRYQYEDTRGGMSSGMGARLVTCMLRVRYDGFEAGKRYFVEARPLAAKAQGYLYDSERNLLARADVLRCGPF